MDPSFSNGGGGGDGNGGGGGGDGVSVRKYTFMNTFLWYFFQTLTLCSMLFIVLSIYWAAFSSANIRVVCVIIVAFAIISPSFIIPKLPQLAAAMAIPIIQLYKNVFIQLLNVFVWLGLGLIYPFAANILCYCLIAGVGLLKLYGTDGESISSFRLIGVIGIDAFGTSFFVFDREKKYGTGRWVDSSTGFSLLGLFVVTLLAHYLPPLVKPEKKKMMNEIEAISPMEKKRMMNEIEAILTKIAASEKKKKKKVNVDHEVNVAEAPVLGSGTKSLLETV